LRTVIVDAQHLGLNQLNVIGEIRAHSAEIMPSTSAYFPLVESEPQSHIDDVVNSKKTDSETENDNDDEEVDDDRDVLGPAVQDQLCQINTSSQSAPGPNDPSQSVDDGPKQPYI
jgi:hypothetical protein